VKQMSLRYPAYSESAFRNLISDKSDEVFQLCVFRPGGKRKVLIYETAFLVWVRGQSSDADKHPL
jgi:hypothetical protein